MLTQIYFHRISIVLTLKPRIIFNRIRLIFAGHPFQTTSNTRASAFCASRNLLRNYISCTLNVTLWLWRSRCTYESSVNREIRNKCIRILCVLDQAVWLYNNIKTWHYGLYTNTEYEESVRMENIGFYDRKMWQYRIVANHKTRVGALS